MATATLAPEHEPQAESPPLRLHRWTLDEYRKLGELGLLDPSDRVVLLDGLLVTKMTKGPRHVTATLRTQKLLAALLPQDWTLRQEAPVEVPGGPRGDSVPEPDLVIASGNDAVYQLRHPSPGEIRLVIQVADSSAAIDRKGLARFAREGIPIVWIVNLTNETVEVHTDPVRDAEAPKYAGRVIKNVGETLTILLDGIEVGPIRVEDLLA